MYSKSLLTAIILTKNEEKNIINCIDSVIGIASEMLVIDDFSNDRTVELIDHLKNPKIKVFKNHLNDDFSAQRNFALSKVSTPWALFVDADERVDSRLADEITRIMLNNDELIEGYLISRVDNIWDKKLLWGEAGSTKLLRLGRVGRGKWKGKVHEVWDIKDKVGQLKNPINHFPHQTIKEFLIEINLYTTLRASELHSKGVMTNGLQIILFPLGKFVFNYIIRRGYRDGLPGFVYAGLMSFHSFLVRSKLYLFTSRHKV